MPEPTNKQQLLDEAQKKYEALGRQVASFTPEEMVRPGVIGTWSIKDILAHLLEWQTMLMGWYEAGLVAVHAVRPRDRLHQRPMLRSLVDAPPRRSQPSRPASTERRMLLLAMLQAPLALALGTPTATME